ncbi:MAG TPA: hypothetical protein VKT73_07240 [Xanthobacteraceae bacterium]|nr:hypothetical protein [Xanthobacteraceae bacterium]
MREKLLRLARFFLRAAAVLLAAFGVWRAIDNFAVADYGRFLIFAAALWLAAALLRRRKPV